MCSLHRSSYLIDLFAVTPLHCTDALQESEVESFPYYFALWLILGTLYHWITLALHALRHIRRSKCAFVPILDRLHKYFQMLLYALALIYAALTIADTATNCCTGVKQHFGLFAVALSWINLIRLFAKFPLVGQHAIIFGRIIWTFLSLSIFGLIVVLTCMIVLLTTFFDSQALVSSMCGNPHKTYVSTTLTDSKLVRPP